MVTTRLKATHHTAFDDTLCAQYREIGPASILAALLFCPSRNKIAAVGKKS